MKTAQAVQVAKKEPVKTRLSGFRRTIRSWASSALKSFSESRGEKLARRSGWFTKEEPVKIISSGTIGKGYVGYEIKWYDTFGFFKYIPTQTTTEKDGWYLESVFITHEEIEKFKADVQAEATDRADIREFLVRHPEFNQPKKLEEKPVEVDLEDGFLSKDYGAVCIVWHLESGFGKWTNEIIGNEFVASKLAHNVKPSEVKKCREDVLEEAKTRPEVAGFLAKYPEFNQ